ncbi:MAG: fimbrillin family protein [Bacteroidales bacterium]|nr:fimbrillin family protein [Bacteroidales bacterium]
MKKAFTYSALVILLAATACNKTDHVVTGDNSIRFAPATAATRALIEDATTLRSQKFEVYDLMGETTYIADSISYVSNAWNYLSGKSYAWKDGSHKFFGFTKDAGTFAGSALTVSKTLTTAEANQVDLLYSEVFSTTSANWKDTKTIKDSVALHMKHLFAAVSINVKNCTEGTVTVSSVSAVSIPNSAKATVDFSGSETVFQYKEDSDKPTVSGDFAPAISGSYSLAYEKSLNILEPDATGKSYFMVWPQTLAKDAVTITVSYTMDGKTKTGSVSLPEGDEWLAGKKYDYTLQILPTDIRLVFQVMPWEEVDVNIDSETGSINMSNVTWQNTAITQDTTATPIVYKNTLDNDAYSVYMFHNASVQVIKRDSNGEPIHEVYATDTVGADGETHAAGDPVVDEYGNPTVYVKIWKEYDYYPAQGYFTVNYPKTGLFKIDLIPAYGQATVDKSKYAIYIYDSSSTAADKWRAINPNGETITNKTVYFQVRASSTVGEIHPQYKAQIDIWFKATGSDEWISAYSEIRANYACVIPAVN